MFKKLLNGGVILQAIVSVGIMTTTWNDAIAQDNSTTTLQTIESRTQGEDIVLDANDFPVLAYQHVSAYGIRSVKVARCTDVNCAGVQVAKLATLEEAGLFVDIDSITVMIDSNDRPVVGYTHNEQLRVARCLDRVCKRVSLQNIGTGQLAAFALDNNDLIAAAYTTDAVAGDSTSRAIDVARCTNEQCNSVTTSRIETIMESRESQRFRFPQRPALAISSNNNPVVSYLDGYSGSESSAIVARCIDSACNVVNKTTIIEDTVLEGGVSMVLDSFDNPIVIVEEARSDLEDLTHYTACLDPDCNDRQERIRRTSWERNERRKPRSLSVAADGSVTFIIVGEAEGDYYPELYYCATTSCDNFEFRGLIAGDTGDAEIYPVLAVDQAGEPVVAFGVWEYYSGQPSPFSVPLGLRVARCGSEPCVNVQDVQNGTYYLQSVVNNRYLSADADMTIGTSSEPGRSEIWYIDTEWESGKFNMASIRNVESNSYLEQYLVSPGVRLRLTTSTTKLWNQIRLDGRGYGILRSRYVTDRNLGSAYSASVVTIDEAGSGLVGTWPSFNGTHDSEILWRIVPTQATPNELVGTKIALQNTVTGRWLDNDPNGNVDQSVNQSTDDIWLVEDAGEGYVYLVNEFTGLYLNAKQGKLNLDSSSTRTLNNRWELRFAGDELTLRSIDFDGYVSAQGFREGFNAIRKSGLSAPSYWTPRIIQ